MRVVTKIITCSRDTKIKIIPIGDVHYGTKNCNVEKLKDLIEWIKNNENTYVILMGDLCDFINADDKRFDIGSLQPELLKYIGDLAPTQTRKIIEIFKPIASKIIGAVRGNHEETIHQRYYEDVHAHICYGLKTKDLGTNSFIQLCFKRISSQERRQIIIYVTHGHGSGRVLGGKVNNLIRLATGISADIYLMGHVHDLFSTSTISIAPTRSCSNIVQKKRIFGYTGTFYQSYKVGTDSYSERQCYTPNKVGVLKIEIKPFIKRSINNKSRSLFPDIHVSE